MRKKKTVAKCVKILTDIGMRKDVAQRVCERKGHAYQAAFIIAEEQHIP